MEVRVLSKMAIFQRLTALIGPIPVSLSSKVVYPLKMLRRVTEIGLKLKKHSKNALLLFWKNLKIDFFKNLLFKFKNLLRHGWPHVWLCQPHFRTILAFFHNSKALDEQGDLDVL